MSFSSSSIDDIAPSDDMTTNRVTVSLCQRLEHGGSQLQQV
jgi:hypothetical protein